jgi:PTS system mannose-specific IIC component
MIDNAGWLLLWGVVVGLDLICVAQTMVSRPLVAGTVAGAIAGDPMAGMAVGVVLELFAFEVLPFGAARYPDYGLGAVAAAAAATGAPAILGTGLGVSLGLIVAFVGGRGIHLRRLRNGLDLERHVDQLEHGDLRTIYSLHLRGLAREVFRSVIVTALGLLLAEGIRRWAPLTVQGAVYLGIVTLGAALSAAVTGAIRLAGRKSAQQWFMLGLLGGLVGLMLR